MNFIVDGAIIAFLALTKQHLYLTYVFQLVKCFLWSVINDNGFMVFHKLEHVVDGARTFAMPKDETVISVKRHYLVFLSIKIAPLTFKSASIFLTITF